ncbi:putative ATP-dependent RNA helicase ddx49 [Coelomomyces lativittatus]|nr:putative ATP-dependent RNA helicase ddx49 [Coelomomyces lativittatus]
MTQKERMQALTRFKSSTLRVLLATDVGARGLDIPKVQLVINFDVPSSAVDYTHRVGRTARAGREGIALSLVTERDIQRLLHIENHVKKHFEGMEVNESEIQKGEFLRSVQIAKREAMFRLEETGFGTKKELNRIKKRKIEALQEEIELEDAVDSASV